MTRQIAPQIEGLIDDMVATGQYADAVDVIEQAVQLLRQRDHNQRIIASIHKAEESVRRGEGVPLPRNLWIRFGTTLSRRVAEVFPLIRMSVLEVSIIHATLIN